jgi:hypothetical protein
MAVKGSGLGAGPDPAMVNQTNYDARKGAPKNTQTAFPVKEGMKDQNAPSGVTSAISPVHPGAGPDASAADVLDPETPAQRGKTLKKQPGGAGAMTNNGTYVPGKLNSSWGMKGGDGQGVDPDMSGKVLGEAILSGSSKLPAANSAASGPAPAYTGKDPN